MVKNIVFHLNEKNTLAHVWGDIETLTEDLARVEFEIEDLKDTLRYKLEKFEVLKTEVKKWEHIKW